MCATSAQNNEAPIGRQGRYADLLRPESGGVFTEDSPGIELGERVITAIYLENGAIWPRRPGAGDKEMAREAISARERRVR